MKATATMATQDPSSHYEDGAPALPQNARGCAKINLLHEEGIAGNVRTPLGSEFAALDDTGKTAMFSGGQAKEKPAGTRRKHENTYRHR